MFRKDQLIGIAELVNDIRGIHEDHKYFYRTIDELEAQVKKLNCEAGRHDWLSIDKNGLTAYVHSGLSGKTICSQCDVEKIETTTVKIVKRRKDD